MMMRSLGSLAQTVAIEDISPGGCRIVTVERAAIGDPIIARLPQLEPLGSRICWTEDGRTGVQFLRTIHPAVFDMLIGRLAS